MIFSPLSSIHDDDRVGSLVTKIISNSIALISIHTNFDAFVNGTSSILANKLNLKIVDFLVPNLSHKNSGMGVIAKANKPMTEHELLKLIQSVCFSPIRFSHGSKTSGIEKIAILGGSGSSFIDYALQSGANAFINCRYYLSHFS